MYKLQMAETYLPLFYFTVTVPLIHAYTHSHNDGANPNHKSRVGFTWYVLIHDVYQYIDNDHIQFDYK